MRILLTDSGLGGLSICANIIQKAKRMKAFPFEEFDVKYVNAVPKMYDGFNLIKPRRKQVHLFDQFLKKVSTKYEPDSIYIVCNSLSAIYSQTEFANITSSDVKGIIKLGIELLNKEYNNSHDGIIILGAETTIKENIYQNELNKLGIPSENIVSQSCPELANTISNDIAGEKIYHLIDKYLSLALDKTPKSIENIIVYLGCTHYGYRKNLFEKYLLERNVKFSIVNPNEYFSGIIIPLDGNSNKYKPVVPTVEFITHYPIPNQEINTISKYLKDISSETVLALQNYNFVDDLY